MAIVVVDASAVKEKTNFAMEFEKEAEIISHSRRYGGLPMVVLNHKGRGLSAGTEAAILKALSSDNGLLHLTTELAAANATNTVRLPMEEDMCRQLNAESVSGCIAHHREKVCAGACEQRTDTAPGE